MPVRHDQAVVRGAPLIQIDLQELDAKVASARADLMNADASVASARAALGSLAAEERMAASNVRAVQAMIAAADAQRATAGAERQRHDHLGGSGAVARRGADRFRAAEISARSAAKRSRADLDVARNQGEPGDYVRPGARLMTIVPMIAL